MSKLAQQAPVTLYDESGLKCGPCWTIVSSTEVDEEVKADEKFEIQDGYYVLIIVQNGKVIEGSGVRVSEFEVDTIAGGSIRQFIEQETRAATLTIPRFRRQTPPTHALIAPNGDVLAQTYVRAGESYVVPAGIAYRITEAR